MADRLEVCGISKNFGALSVASNVTFGLAAGDRTALIGPNGAGKTTIVNMITGVTAPSAGDIRLDGRSIVRMPQHERVRAGIARTFQINRLFRDLSVEDNIRMAVLQQQRCSWQVWTASGSEAAIVGAVDRVLAMLELQSARNKLVRTLAYGEQRLVEIALALALEPRVLLLDEPAAGVPKSESSIVMDAIAALPPGLAVLLIEHDMDLVFRFARRVIVLASGQLLASGSNREIAADERVKQLYFGRGHNGAPVH